MVIEQRSTPSPRQPVPPAGRRARPHWGYLSRSVSRYGVVSSTLVIYSPDASERDRRRADVARGYGVLAFGGGLLLWIGCAAAGIPPLWALAAIAAAAIPLGAVLARRTRGVRRAAAVVTSCSSGLRVDGEDRDAQRRLDAIADSIQGASAAYRAGALDPQAFDRIWRAAYAHARS
ncbi:conserved hypothetical protein [Microbacterium sp. 8M]|uniref:DUF6611 family protein n=1 Tax=Microbacterium sp. 8M TaxID=2653153 RepID=UPI0012F42E35|nr:DUF6611 family protein [Microbacterium sp. 8M]VXB53553.1 conserved hypothetical protein [Microbacterium sp. 8M]